MPRRTVHARLVARVNVLLGSPAPALSARDQLALDHALGAERDGDLSVGRLGRRRHEDPRDASQGSLHLRPAHDLGEVGRADLFLALGDEHEVERRLLARGADGVQRGEERRLGALLVHGAAPDQHLAEPGPVDERGVPGRRRPLGGIDLLDVVHEVQAERARRAGVERGEDAGLAVGRDLRHLVEARVLEHAHGELAALVHAAVLGGDGGLPDPLLQARHGFVVMLVDLREDRGEVVGAPRRGGRAGPREGGGGGGGALEEGAAVHAHEGPPGCWGRGRGARARFNLAWRPLLAEVPRGPQHMEGFRAAYRSGGFVAQRTSFFALALVALGAAGASGQERQISGRVTSATNGEPIAGVNVSVTGAAFAAVTNADGRYTISAPSGAATLVFRRIGFKRKEVPVAPGQATADLKLEEDVFNLEAVVVTGQQTGVSRANAATSSTVVTGAEITGVPAPAVDRALQGRVPGAYIQQNSGAPGGGTQIPIPGSNTVIGSADPLFVVDGVIYSDASISSGLFTVTASGNPPSTRNDGEKQDDSVNRLTDLNPNDIASIDILRGAAASSIYGSKGVNGVVIITTNRGKAGKPRANIVQRIGVSELQRGFGTRVFDTTSAIALYASSGNVTDDSTARAQIMSYLVNGRLPTYDHLREVAGEKPISYETQLDVSGGSGDTRYFLSGNVKGDGGIIANTGAQRQTLRANLNQSFSDRFSVSFTSAFNRTTTQRGFTNNDNSGASITYGIAYIPGYVPITPVNGVFPNPGVTYKGSNPLQTIALAENDESAVRFTGGLTATYQAIASANTSLRIVAAGGIDFFNQRNKVWAPRELYFQANQANPGVATVGNADSRFTNWNLNAIHTYTATSFKTTTSAGVQWEDRQLNRARVEADGLLPGQQNINQGSVLTPFEELTHERTVGLYGQEEWLGLRDRLLLSVGARAERSSANGEIGRAHV